MKELHAWTDIMGVRAMTLVFEVDSEMKEYKFGALSPIGIDTVYSFEKGMQLLGLYGKVMYDPEGVKGDHLMAMSVFKEECAATELLYFSFEE